MGNANLDLQESATKSERIKFRNARRAPGCCLLCLLILTARHKQSVPESTAEPQQPSASDRQTFVANGLVKELEPDGKTAHSDPGHWSFLTGGMFQIVELANQFGENFFSENDSITHNLRTVVVDAHGRVRKIFQGNDWTSADLVREMVKANAD